MMENKEKTLMKNTLFLIAILLFLSACSEVVKPKTEQIREEVNVEEIIEEEPTKPSPYQVTKEKGYDCGEAYEKE